MITRYYYQLARDPPGPESRRGLIKLAIKKALSKEFNQKIKLIRNPYGDGNSSKKILKILKETKINNKLLTKNITI